MASMAFVSTASAVLTVSVSRDTLVYSARKKSMNARQIPAATAGPACEAVLLFNFNFLFLGIKMEAFSASVASFSLESAAKIQSKESNVALVFVRAKARASKRMRHLSLDVFVSLVRLAKDSGNERSDNSE